VVVDTAERKELHLLVAQMFGPDGEAVGPYVEKKFWTPPQVNPDLEPATMVVLELRGLTFPTPGVYTLQVSINGRELKRVRLGLTEGQT
jgi:hypothetical protein